MIFNNDCTQQITSSKVLNLVRETNLFEETSLTNRLQLVRRHKASDQTYSLYNTQSYIMKMASIPVVIISRLFLLYYMVWYLDHTIIIYNRNSPECIIKMRKCCSSPDCVVVALILLVVLYLSHFYISFLLPVLFVNNKIMSALPLMTRSIPSSKLPVSLYTGPNLWQSP